MRFDVTDLNWLLCWVLAAASIDDASLVTGLLFIVLLNLLDISGDNVVKSFPKSVVLTLLSGEQVDNTEYLFWFIGFSHNFCFFLIISSTVSPRLTAAGFFIPLWLRAYSLFGTLYLDKLLPFILAVLVIWLYDKTGSNTSGDRPLLKTFWSS